MLESGVCRKRESLLLQERVLRFRSINLYERGGGRGRGGSVLFICFVFFFLEEKSFVVVVAPSASPSLENRKNDHLSLPSYVKLIELIKLQTRCCGTVVL